MTRFLALLLIVFTVASCASRSRLKRYENDLNEIRTEVRNIRILTDEMKDQLGTMSHTVVKMNEDVKQQTTDIEAQKAEQDRMREVLDKLKGSVVKLESEAIPAKKTELYGLAVTPPETMVVKTETDGKITTIYTEAPLSDESVERDNIKTRPVKDGDSGFGYAVKDGVILWQYPTNDSDVLEILVSWQQLILLEKVKKGGHTWWKVKTNDYTGFVNSRFIIVSD
ncbi:MAG: hypothetical protein AB7E76_12360 [Deferribacterales bacterium]|jgi:hypothetical protein